MTASTRDLACREVVELVTDYLEGRLSPADHASFEAHLAECDGCATYVEQMRQTLAALGRIPEDSISAQARDELLRLFEDYHRSG